MTEATAIGMSAGALAGIVIGLIIGLLLGYQWGSAQTAEAARAMFDTDRSMPRGSGEGDDAA